MDERTKFALPPLTQISLGQGVSIVAMNQQQQQQQQPIYQTRRNVFPQQNQVIPTHLAPLKPVQIMRPILPAVPVQQSAYPFIVEDPSFIQLTATTKHISGSAPRFFLRIPISERRFEDVIEDPTAIICPKQFGFIPVSTWPTDSISFGTLVVTFFRRRNSSSSKFPYKLYNALRITEFIPDYFPHVGVKWVTDNIIWVNRESFARLLGVKTIEGGLFHQQGNFPSHGFEELSFEESERLAKHLGLGPIDLSVMRLMRHSTGIFRRDSKESDLERCKWKGV